jgi:hypothetical protein
MKLRNNVLIFKNIMFLIFNQHFLRILLFFRFSFISDKFVMEFTPFFLSFNFKLGIFSIRHCAWWRIREGSD